MKKALHLLTALLISIVPFTSPVSAAAYRIPQQQHMTKSGKPDKRYKENKHLKKDGTPDKRYKSGKKAATKQ